MSWDPEKAAVRIARDLREIVDLCGQLDDEARSKGDPTSEAAMLLGPVANIEAWQHRFDAIEEAGGDTSYVDDQAAELHPLIVLGGWEEVVREELDRPSDLRITVERAASWLRHHIDWMVGEDENGDANFLPVTSLMDDLHKCRTMLEGLLKAGGRSDRGAPCLQCGVLLVRQWEGSAEDPASHDDDYWRCPNRDCEVTRVEDDELNLVLKSTFRQYSPWLTATDIEAEYRVPVGTVQGWASKKLVRKRRDQEHGRTMYSVEDVLTQRDGVSVEDGRIGT